MLEKIGTVIGLLVLVAVLLAWPVQLLWNGCLIGAVDGVHQIGFWQAMGLNILFGILLRSSATSK